MTQPSDTYRRLSGDMRERIRAAIVKLNHLGKGMTITLVREECGGNRNDVAAVVRDFREGRTPPLSDSWATVASAPSPSADGRAALAELVARARGSDADREEVAHEAARLLALRQISSAEAKALTSLLAEARQGAKRAQETEPPRADDRRIALVTDEAREIAEIFDCLVSDDARVRIRTYVEREAEMDVVENPNPETETGT